MDRNCSHTSSFCCESYDTWHVWTTWDKTKIKTPRLTGGDTQRTKLTPGAHHYLPVDSVYGRWGCRGCRSLFSYWKDYWRQNWTWNPTDSSLSSHRQGSHERLPAGRHWFLSHLNLCYTWFVCFFLTTCTAISFLDFRFTLTLWFGLCMEIHLVRFRH